MSIAYLSQNLSNVWPIQNYGITNDNITEISGSNMDGSLDQTDSSTIDVKFKTELCKNYKENGICKYETRCKFAHGKHELVNKKVNNFYKQRNCETFFTKGACPYGSRCTFRHDERRIDLIQKPFQTKLLDLTKELKKNYDSINKFGFEQSDPNLKANKSKRLNIFNDITDENVTFSSKRIAVKLEAKKKKLMISQSNVNFSQSIVNQII